MSIAATAEPMAASKAPPAPGPADTPREADSPPPPPPVILAPSGRLLHPSMTTEEKHFAIGIHLSPLAGFAFPILFFAPLVLWLIQKDKSTYVDDHGREVINLGITVFLASILLSISIVGLPLIAILWVVWGINVIRGAIAASNGEYFRYPLTIRFLS